MSKWIDADDVANAIYHHFPSIRTMADARGIIEEAPSIDIVFCEECIKRMREDCPMCNGCKLDRVPTEDDDFCSYGEREGE